MSESKELFFQLFSHNSFLKINKKILMIFGPEFSVVLLNLIDKFEYFDQRNMTEDGWFFLTEQEQMENTGMSLERLQKTKKNINEVGFIEIKRKGIPAKLFYKINYQKIMGFLEINKENTTIDDENIRITTNNKLWLISVTGGIRERSQVMANIGNYIRRPKEGNLKKETKNMERSRSPISQENISSKKPSLKERNEKFFPLAEKLSKTISSKKNIIHTTKQLNQWSNEFRILEEQNGIELKRQRKVLYEYSKIYGLDYVPEVESGSAFRQKFIKIEAAIERHKNPRKNNQQSKPTNRFMSKNNAPRDRIDVIVDNGVWTRLTNENGDRINV